jgi:hypothetical protein
LVQFADAIRKPIQLLYYPPYHSKYNPVERCWRTLGEHWSGTQLHDAETMLQWAKSMTWKGLHPVVELSCTAYAKGVTLSNKAMREADARLQRNPELPKWGILIQPASSLYKETGNHLAALRSERRGVSQQEEQLSNGSLTTKTTHLM